MSPRGRRPAGEDTRGLIVRAARAEFGDQGYDRASIRGIARAAGVDARLVHHYFDSKSALFAEVLDVPVNPAEVIGALIEGPPEGEAVLVTSPLEKVFAYLDDQANSDVFVEVARYKRSAE